jgi:hypothetical protein
VVDAGIGSFEVELGAVGVVAMVLLSDPVQLLLTAQALVAMPSTIRAWIRRRRGDREQEPDLELLELARLDPAEFLGAPSQVLEIPGGGLARGHRILMRRRHPDGTEDLFLIE